MASSALRGRREKVNRMKLIGEFRDVRDVLQVLEDVR